MKYIDTDLRDRVIQRIVGLGGCDYGRLAVELKMTRKELDQELQKYAVQPNGNSYGNLLREFAVLSFLSVSTLDRFNGCMREILRTLLAMKDCETFARGVYIGALVGKSVDMNALRLYTAAIAPLAYLSCECFGAKYQKYSEPYATGFVSTLLNVVSTETSELPVNRLELEKALICSEASLVDRFRLNLPLPKVSEAITSVFPVDGNQRDRFLASFGLKLEVVNLSFRLQLLDESAVKLNTDQLLVVRRDLEVRERAMIALQELLRQL